MDEKDNDFKKNVDDLFDSLKPQSNTFHIKPEQKGSKAEFCLEKAYEELEQIRVKFIEFQDSISNFALSDYLIPAIDQFAIFASSISALIDNDFVDKGQDLTDVDRKKLKELNKLRAEILSSIYEKYKEKE